MEDIHPSLESLFKKVEHTSILLDFYIASSYVDVTKLFHWKKILKVAGHLFLEMSYKKQGLKKIGKVKTKESCTLGLYNNVT